MKRYSIKSNPMGEGYWIGPAGETAPVSEHLIALQQDPHIFGLAKRDVAGAGLEQLRRLAVALIEDGWIRARFLSPQGYLFEINRITPENVRRIEEFLVGQTAYEKEPITIETVSPARTYQGSIAGFFDKTIFRYYQNPSKRKGKWRLS
ncbi:MAG: hypothetical protein V1701_02665 [Planctomycetota bacterium]